MARVVLEHLTKVFPGRNQEVRALNDLCLTIEKGELLVLLGPSGCGKTTTLRLLAGLETPTAGTIRFDDQLMNNIAPKERDVAMVFQQPALYPHLSVYENLAFGLRLRRCSPTEVERRVQAAADLLGLGTCLPRRPTDLSGGQRQRVALGRALVRQPRLFLFDEPLSHLDAPLRAQMRLELSRLHAHLGTTMLYVTHDQAEAMTLGGRVALLRDGVLQQAGDPLGLYRRPANTFVASFIGSPSMNLLAGTLEPHPDGLLFRAAPPPGTAGAGLALRLEEAQAERLKPRAGKTVILGLRPEHIANNTRPGETPRAQTQAAVELVEPLGAETYLRLNVGGHPLVVRVAPTDPVAAGSCIPISFDLRQAHFFDPETHQALG